MLVRDVLTSPVTGSIGDRVWNDLNGNGTQDAGEPGLVGATVQLLFAGRDGVFGTGDDVTIDVTTGADGAYSAANLPEGNYRVTVPGGLPGGLSPTFGQDDSAPVADGTANVTVGTADRTDIDFGFTGALELGGTVWFDADADADAVRDGGELGLAGVGVEIRFAGADGTFGTADDLVFPKTTDAAGAFAVDRLPAGDYRVSVDPADLRPGPFPPSTRTASPRRTPPRSI